MLLLDLYTGTCIQLSVYSYLYSAMWYVHIYVHIDTLDGCLCVIWLAGCGLAACDPGWLVVILRFDKIW
jgi:hypothetical protein